MSTEDQLDLDRQFMQRALDVCREGVGKGQSPFGACLVRDGNVLATTHNHVRLDTDPSAHAEVVCIRRACKQLGTIDLTGTTIYTTTEPCPMCFACIHWARIDRIVYAARVQDATQFGFNELSVSNASLKQLTGSPITLTADLMREQALVLYDLWQHTGGEPY